jgi:hypothetical protein
MSVGVTKDYNVYFKAEVFFFWEIGSGRKVTSWRKLAFWE